MLPSLLRRRVGRHFNYQASGSIASDTATARAVGVPGLGSTSGFDFTVPSA